MANSLQSLFQAIALAGNERELRHCFMDGISDNFDVRGNWRKTLDSVRIHSNKP
jgi:hypothetical protein